MDLKKTGALIAELRKQKNMTQKDLALQLGVTDKAISRWETGKGFPDISILGHLADALDVTITELVNGERCTPESDAGESDRAVMSAFAYARSMRRTLLCVIMAIAGVALLFAPLVVLGANNGILMVSGIALLAFATMMHFIPSVWPEKRSRILAMLIILAGFALECIPGSAVLIFASGPKERIVERVACFDLTLVGYAHAAPFLGAILTTAAAVMLLMTLFDCGKKLKNAAYIISILAALFMLMPLLFFGFAYFTELTAAVTFFLLLSSWFQARANAASRS